LGGIAKRGFLSIPYADDTLPTAKLVAGAQPDIATGSQTLKHRDRLECLVIGITAIDLQLVRLHGDLVFPGRSRLVSLDKLDIRVRIIDPDGGCTSCTAGLFDAQYWLVVFTIRGFEQEDCGCRAQLAFI